MDNDYPNLQKNCKVLHLSNDNLYSSSLNAKSSIESIYVKDNYLYGWGKNKYGELGIGTLSNVCFPTPIVLETQSINSIQSGGRNSIILSSDDYIYLCGSNIFGLLALNSANQNNEQKQKYFKKIKYFIENNISIKEVSIAEFHCLTLDKDGIIYGWGGNLFNKLGRKYDILEGKPNKILIKEKIKSISCGDYHSCAISEEGILYSWGGGGESYNKGQCGHGTTKDIQKPKKVEFFIKNDLKIKKVSCGGYHTIVIADSEELFSFGKSIYGQCGYGQHENISSPTKVFFDENQNLKYENNKEIIITDIKCGGEHSLFLSSNNKVYACGHGYLGQLGLGNNKNFDSPIIVKSLTNKKIIEIAAGWSHSLVLSGEGNIYSTGCNKYGELGIGKDFNKYNYTWVKCLSNFIIKHISAGGHHSWCLINSNNPLREGDNNPEPLLKSNFTMTKKIKRNFSDLSKQSKNRISSFNERRWNKNKFEKSSISADNSVRRRNNISEGNDFDANNKRKNSHKKLKKIFDDYNNNENEMSIDKLIENINKIDNYENDIKKNEDDDENNASKYFINSKENINNSSVHPFKIKNINPQKEDDDENNNILIKTENYNYFLPKQLDSDEENNYDNDILNRNGYNNKIKNNKSNIYKINKNEEEEEEDEDEERNKLLYDKINNNTNNINRMFKEEEEDKNKLINNKINIDCELKIIYSDLNLSHRFIRFQSSIDYNKLNYIIKKKFLDKDLGNISSQLQRDDEIEKNYSISSEIDFIFNKMKKEKLINLDELSKSFTLGIVYDCNKNVKIKQLKEKIELNNINNASNINNKKDVGPICGIKSINLNQILSSEKEKILSKWIIDFCQIYNNLIDKEKNKLINKHTFLELRPKIFKEN